MNDKEGPRTSLQPSSVDAVYAAVASRRSQFDNLVWQVPTFSLAAQACLFTIALDPNSSRYSRGDSAYNHGSLQ